MTATGVKRRLVVTGAGGMVGSYAADALSDDTYVLTDVVPGYTPLDVTDPGAVMALIAQVKPDAVLHLAAATDVDRCQQEPEWAFKANAIGTQNVALACLEHNATLVYVSTAAIFSGEQMEPYTEFDAPDPANLYGRSKLAGEQVVASLLPRSYIVRSSWMIGGGERDKKFVGKIARQIASGATRVQAVTDKQGCPTYARDLLRGIRRLLETGFYGLYHMANPGPCSRYDVAVAIRDALNRPDVEIVPASSEGFPLPAPRPRSEALRNLKLELLGLPLMRPSSEALREYVQRELAPVLVP